MVIPIGHLGADNHWQYPTSRPGPGSAAEGAVIVYSPFGREMAKAHIEDLHRHADAERLMKGIRAARAAERRARYRRVSTALLSAIHWPIRPRRRVPVSVPEAVPLPALAEPTPVEIREEDVAVREAPPARSPLFDPADDPLAEDERRGRRVRPRLR